MAESLERLQERRERLWKRMRALEPFFKGSVVELEVRCGKPNCRCTRGEKHRACYVSLKREGKTQMHYLPRDRQEAAREASRRYREFRELVEELSVVQIQILKRRGGAED